MMTIVPALIYVGVGLLVARISLEGTSTRGYTWLQWIQLAVTASYTSLLWPLILLEEKVTAWLKAAPLEEEVLVVSPEPVKELQGVLEI